MKPSPGAASSQIDLKIDPHVFTKTPYFVADADVRPVITGKKTDLPPPQPESAPAELVAGDTKTSTGSPSGLQLAGTQQLALGVTVNVVCKSACYPAFDLLGSDTISFNDDGSVASVNAGKDPLTGVSNFGNDGFIAWGVGKDRYGQHFHYVTGLPAMYGDLSSLAISQPVAYFDLITQPNPSAIAVNSATGAAVTGQLTGGVLEARFGAGYVNARLDIAIAGNNLTVQANNLGFYNADGTLGFYNDSATCTTGGSCSGEVKGFIGTGAARAGAIYRVSVSGASLPGPVVGAAAFTNRNPPAAQ